jgi:hypothetical protein
MASKRTPGTPAPLHDASGRLIATFSPSISNDLLDDYGKLPGGPFDLDVLIGCFPYRSFMLHEPRGVIGIILIAPSDHTPPSPAVCESVADTWFRGQGILLLGASRDARDAARHHITELLQRARKFKIASRTAP